MEGHDLHRIIRNPAKTAVQAKSLSLISACLSLSLSHYACVTLRISLILTTLLWQNTEFLPSVSNSRNTVPSELIGFFSTASYPCIKQVNGKDSDVLQYIRPQLCTVYYFYKDFTKHNSSVIYIFFFLSRSQVQFPQQWPKPVRLITKRRQHGSTHYRRRELFTRLLCSTDHGSADHQGHNHICAINIRK